MGTELKLHDPDTRIQHGERQHAKLAPSAAERWIACPGSIRLCEQLPPQKSSEYAEEGTAAHELAHAALTNPKKDLLEFNGEVFNGHTVDADMIDHVQVYVTDVTETIAAITVKKEPTYYGLETRLDLSWLIPGCFGSADFWAWDRKNKVLYVKDLKYGQGVVVEPYENPQAKIYALGALHLLMTQVLKCGADQISKYVEKVVITIVQPRAFHPDGPIRSWETTAQDLLFWGVNVLAPAALLTEDVHAPKCAGSHCRFCPGIAACDEQVKYAMAIAKTDFEPVLLPEPAELTPEDIVKVLEASDMFSTWADKVKAFATQQMECGVSIPGYKLVAKRAVRKWIDEKKAQEVLEEYLGDDAWSKKYVTLADAEKILKRKGLSSDAVLQGLWEKPEGGVILAPESDNRPAVAGTSAMDFLEGADFLK